MSRVEGVRKKVAALYTAKHEARDEWADWMWEWHVMVVADHAARLAERYPADKDIAVAAALLHDIADAVTERRDPRHKEESDAIARRILAEEGFTAEEMAIIVDDAMRFHSCHGAEAPQSLEGKILATADALAHLTTDFYDYGIAAMRRRGETPEHIKTWITEKAERDYRKKIAFDDVRAETEKDYKRITDLIAHYA